MCAFGDYDDGFSFANFTVLSSMEMMKEGERERELTRWISAHISSSQGITLGGLSGMKMKSAPPLHRFSARMELC